MVAAQRRSIRAGLILVVIVSAIFLSAAPVAADDPVCGWATVWVLGYPYPVSQIPYCAPADCQECSPPHCNGLGQGPGNVGQTSTVKAQWFVCVNPP